MTRTVQGRDELRAILDDVVAEVRKAAPSIYDEAVEAARAKDRPEPRRADFDRFGIAVFTREGDLVAAGNAGTGFPIQSISKVFALELALESLGDDLWARIGREPSGDPFNSIIDLERLKGIPRNPFINAGALVVCDVLAGMKGRSGPNRHVVDFIEGLIDEETLEISESVMESDRSGGDLNRSLMLMARHHGNLKRPVEDVMEAYVHQCAITLTCRGLAKAGRFLMQDDVREAADGRGLSADRRARRILSIMMLCGQYDGSGDFAYRVGLPAKSGVGGGILAVAPHRASIAVWSPALDPMGNSWLGVHGLERLSQCTDWSVFGAVRN